MADDNGQLKHIKEMSDADLQSYAEAVHQVEHVILAMCPPDSTRLSGTSYIVARALELAIVELVGGSPPAAEGHEAELEALIVDIGHRAAKSIADHREAQDAGDKELAKVLAGLSEDNADDKALEEVLAVLAKAFGPKPPGRA